jgi:uncharacterized protein YdiU (UPF0061 family)
MNLKIENTFTDELPADIVLGNSRRQVKHACFSWAIPRKAAKPLLIHTSKAVSDLIGLDEDSLKTENFRDFSVGNYLLDEMKPYAMCYAGHQFGNWAGQLGDGRAINLSEVLHNKKRWTLQLKGAGETPYSRTADGLAVLRSSIREYLCSEAMFNLGVPTTRALSLSLTGDQVLRDILYNGNSAYEQGAIVCRVAKSFIRFGNFEILAAQQDHITLKKLADYTLKYCYPEINSSGKKAYIALFEAVCKRSLAMVIHWQRVGFVHGVMNTDNMSILGDTIDYGPYGWLEGYDPQWTPNTTDSEFRRYRFGNQPEMVLWNLYKLANALYPLIQDSAPLELHLEQFREDFEMAYLNMMCRKIGIEHASTDDLHLIKDLDHCLGLAEIDFTIFFRLLGNYTVGNATNGIAVISDAFYNINALTAVTLNTWKLWFVAYDKRISKLETSDVLRKTFMNTVNPKYVLRNYMAQLAIDQAEKGDYTLVHSLYDLLLKPYDEQPVHEKWFAKRPNWAKNKVGCSMLSCSS